MTVTTIGSLLLGPTLVFGAFGANVALPLGGSWAGLTLMISLAVLSVIAVYFLLNHMVNRFGRQQPKT